MLHKNPIANTKFRQYYVEALFRYYISPFVVAGIINPMNALNWWSTISKKIHGIN